MSLLTEFCQNTTSVSRFVVRKLSANHSAGNKSNKCENSRASNLAWRVLKWIYWPSFIKIRQF